MFYLGNTTVTYVTAHNAKYVNDNKIGKGAIIKIVRSGDVIPYIVSIVKPAKKPDMPDMDYEWNATNVDIMVVDPSDDILRRIIIKQNEYFFRKIGVKFLSAGIMTKLYDAGYETIISIVAAASSKDTAPYNISGLGNKMVTKIYDQIDKAFARIKLPELMSGSLKFGQGLGVRKLRDIIKKYPDILSECDTDEDEIVEKILLIKGFSNILATKFANGLGEFCEFLNELKENSDYDLAFEPPPQVIVAKGKNKKEIESEDEENNENGIMANQIVVITGFRSPQIDEFIEANGGKIATGGVNGKTTLVIYADEKKSFGKIQKAKNLIDAGKNIRLMTRDEFEAEYLK